jgi:predicted amidophosphoribosyltransferase
MSGHEDEKRTIRQMIAIYCSGTHHPAGTLCDACRDLLAYAERRLDRCPHGEKPACKDCAVHCYEPEKRQAIREVMRYAGPRMLLHHPLAALAHAFRKGKR